MYVTKRNILLSNPPMRLFIGLCKKKNSSCGFAIQLCAPLTDWNIPHRGLASLLRDRCLHDEKLMKGGCIRVDILQPTSTGHFNILLYATIFIFYGLPVSPCNSNKHFLKLLYGYCSQLVALYRVVEHIGAHEYGFMAFFMELIQQAVRQTALPFPFLPFFSQPFILTDCSLNQIRYPPIVFLFYRWVCLFNVFHWWQAPVNM